MTPRLTAVTFFLCLFVAACAKDQAAPPIIGVPAPDREPWFCQTGADTEGWECVRDLELATLPRLANNRRSSIESAEPDRRREAGRPAQTDMASSAEISAASPVARGARPPDAETQPATTTPSPVSPAPTRRAVRNRSTASEAKAAVDASLPKYLRLAYRPREAVAIIDLPEDFWTVQLIALGSAEALEAYAQKEGLRGMSAAKISANGKLYYVLLLGVYETKANAVEAAEDLGPPFENPWVRSLGSLQKAMLAADRLNPPG